MNRIWLSGRVWGIGGVFVALVALAVGWFVFIGPRTATTADLQAQVSETDQRLTSLRRRLVTLREDFSEVEQYRRALAADRDALPAASGMSDFLRQLQAAASAGGVTVDGVVVGGSTQVAELPAVYSLPITLNVLGPAPQLIGFVDHLQQELPRAVLLNSINAVPAGKSPSLQDSASLTITLQVFVAASAENTSPAHTPAPTPAS